jgi:hypothetical protein
MLPPIPASLRQLARVPGPSGRLRALASVGLAMLACACTSPSTPVAAGRIVLVDGLGAPVQGAVVLPEEENQRGSSPKLWSHSDIEERTSDSQGIVHIGLESYLWDSDACYHFRILRTGFEDVTMSVSRELFPPQLRITLETAPQKATPPPAWAPSSGAPAAAQAQRQP